MAVRAVGSWQLAVSKSFLLGVLLGFVSCDRPIAEKKLVSDELNGKQPSLREGDIIFQTSESSQSKAIQLATGSPYSHLGIIFREEGTFYVCEAVQPVRYTSLEEFINRGKNGHYAIKRLKNADEKLPLDIMQKMKGAGEKFLGKDYDLYFGWSDDRIYCSELVYKIYKEGAGIEIGKLEKLKEFDLDHPIVQKKLVERYGKKIPYDEPVVSPASIFNNPELVTVAEQ